MISLWTVISLMLTRVLTNWLSGSLRLSTFSRIGCQGRYDSAAEHFNKAYNIARATNDAKNINAARVLCGVATAHKMLSHFAAHVQTTTRPAVERLIEWKDNRADEFEKEIPQHSESHVSHCRVTHNSIATRNLQQAKEKLSARMQFM